MTSAIIKNQDVSPYSTLFLRCSLGFRIWEYKRR